jgi:hypothetical protein
MSQHNVFINICFDKYSDKSRVEGKKVFNKLADWQRQNFLDWIPPVHLADQMQMAIVEQGLTNVRIIKVVTPYFESLMDHFDSLECNTMITDDVELIQYALFHIPYNFVFYNRASLKFNVTKVERLEKTGKVVHEAGLFSKKLNLHGTNYDKEVRQERTHEKHKFINCFGEYYDPKHKKKFLFCKDHCLKENFTTANLKTKIQILCQNHNYSAWIFLQITEVVYYKIVKYSNLFMIHEFYYGIITLPTHVSHSSHVEQSDKRHDEAPWRCTGAASRAPCSSWRSSCSSSSRVTIALHVMEIHVIAPNERLFSVLN